MEEGPHIREVAMSTRAAILVAVLPLALACASAGGSASSSGPRSDRNLITAEEIAGVSVSNLYDAVRLLRPEWLNQRPNPSAITPGAESDIIVYMDRIRFGTPEQLRQFPPSVAVSVRFLSPSQAEGEFGVGNMRGAILVTTRRNP
jgi:hypothetical protein